MGQQIPSKEVYHGRNFSNESDKFVRCSRCGFPCKIGRDQQASDGSRIGWGITNTSQETCVIEYDQPEICYYGEHIVDGIMASFSYPGPFTCIQVLGDQSGDEKRVAQSFVTTGGYIKAASFYCITKYSTPTGTITIRIETDSSGLPSGTLVNPSLTATVGTVELEAWNTATFTKTSVPVGKTYWMVLDCDDQSNSRMWYLGNKIESGTSTPNCARSDDGGASWTVSHILKLGFKIDGESRSGDNWGSPNTSSIVIKDDFLRDYDAPEAYDTEFYYDSYGQNDGSLSYDSVKIIYDPIVTTGCPQCGSLRYDK